MALLKFVEEPKIKLFRKIEAECMLKAKSKTLYLLKAKVGKALAKCENTTNKVCNKSRVGKQKTS